MLFCFRLGILAKEDRRIFSIKPCLNAGLLHFAPFKNRENICPIQKYLPCKTLGCHPQKIDDLI
jgi:hypothetical protein